MRITITLGKIRRLVREALGGSPVDVPPEAAEALLAMLDSHPNRQEHELWTGDDGTLNLDVPDDDLRSVERYEWADGQWKHWDSEPYYE